MKKIFVLLLFAHTLAAQIYKPRPVVAILGAFDDEVALLEGMLQNKKTEMVHGITFHTGQLKGQKVIVALTGIGKVNAAMTTTLLLQRFRPARLIFTGIAGGVNPDLQPGDIVIGQKVAHHDFGMLMSDKFLTSVTLNPINKKANPMYFLADTTLLSLARQSAAQLSLAPLNGRTPTITVGTIATGDVFVASDEKVKWLRETLQADATEMEGAAVAQVCFQQQVPHIVIRSISDKADANAREAMFNFRKVAAQNSANLTLSILEKLRQ
ncbi:MAG: 5'-methylthioadenosine/adenosylhomocysteine nucleosidase [Runella sp.]